MADISHLVAASADEFARITKVDGSMTYIAIAPPGTAHTAAAWQAKRVEEVDANTSVTTWADGDAKADNVPGANGANLSSLSYS